MLIRLLLPSKSFRSTLLNHFISKVVHDMFSFRCEVLANGPRLCQVRFHYFLPNLLLHMRRNGHSCPSGILAFWYKIKFSVPGFVHNPSFGRVLSHFGHF